MFGTSSRRRLGSLLAAATVMLIGTAPTSPAAAASSHIKGAGARSAIPNSYIVILKGPGADLTTTAKALAKAHHGSLGSVWSAFDGFSVRMSAGDAQQLSAETVVDFVQQDQTQVAARPAQAGSVAVPAAVQQPVPSWGLDRIDQVEPVDDSGAPALDGKYAYDDVAGEGAGVYVLGTGVTIGQGDFGGRAEAGVDVVGDGGSAAGDCVGFTTKFADIIGGTVYGVAKKTSLVAVRMENCRSQFTSQNYLDAVSWVISHGVHPAVIFQTIGDFCVDANNAIVTCPPDFTAAQVRAEESAYANGYLVIDAGGDAPQGGVGQNACTKATGAGPHTLYVGATRIDPSTHKDQLAAFSDFGSCVTMYAPGAGIPTATGPVVDGSADGSTGAAAAFVAGTAALVLSEPEFANATPAQIADELVINRSTSPATVGHPVIEGLDSGSHDRMLFTGPPGFFTIGDQIGLAQRPDGRLQLTGVTRDGHVVSRAQSQPGSAGWDPWVQSATKGWYTIATGTNADGRVALAGIAATGQMYTRNQSTAGWFSWRQMDGASTWIALAHNSSNRLELFGTNAAGLAGYRSQKSPGASIWTPWTNFAVPGRVASITVATTMDNRIEVFVLDAGGRIWHSSQGSANDNNWGPFTNLDGFSVRSITATRNGDGRLELTGLDSGGNPWHRSETSPGADTWTGWTPLPTKTLVHLAAAANPVDGRIQLDGVDGLGAIWQSTQQQTNENTYSAWTPVDGVLRP